MARPQVPDGGTACNMEGSCEYIEEAVVESRQSEVLQLGGLGLVLTSPPCKNVSFYEIFTQKSSDLYCMFGIRTAGGHL